MRNNLLISVFIITVIGVIGIKVKLCFRFVMRHDNPFMLCVLTHKKAGVSAPAFYL